MKFHRDKKFIIGHNTKTINYLDPCLNIKLPITNVIISEKDAKANFIKPIDYIIFGGNGFIDAVS